MYLFLGAAVMLLAAGGLYQLVGTRIGARSYAAPGMIVDADGQPLHVVCAGNGGPAVVFESGIAASSLSWARVLRDVGAFTRACAYDRAGLGWSPQSRAPRTVDRILRELRSVVAHAVSGRRAVLVGHSFGAFLVAAYASRHPADVAGLILLDPPSEWHELTRHQARLLRGGAQLSRVGGVLARFGIVRACLALLTGGAPGIPRRFVRVFGPTTARMLERLVGEVRKLPPEVHPVVQMLWCQPKCFRAMAEHLGALEETAAAVSQVASLSDVPLVVISAADQPRDVLERHRRLAQLSPCGRHLIASTSGHWIQFDDPDLVIATVRSMVNQVRRTHAA